MSSLSFTWIIYSYTVRTDLNLSSINRFDKKKIDMNREIPDKWYKIHYDFGNDPFVIQI